MDHGPARPKDEGGDAAIAAVSVGGTGQQQMRDNGGISDGGVETHTHGETAEAVGLLLDGLGVSKAEEASEESTIELIAKWRGEEITLGLLPISCTVRTVKLLLEVKTSVLPQKQKLIGLSVKGSSRPAPDDTQLAELLLTKKPFRFMLMGTPEAELFVDPGEREDLPEVFDDLDMDCSSFSEEWRRSVQNSDNLRKFTASTVVHLINQPRPHKRLLVLDLDHTLLDFSSRTSVTVQQMKRPYLDTFLTAVYPHYDLVAWSQTSWRWLEIKMVELGMLTHTGYRFTFVLDKTSMFHVESVKSDGRVFQHQVKPLQIIWSKFPQYSETNTLHVDDLSRNFALNQHNGIKIRGYYRKHDIGGADRELILLGKYLVELATKDGGSLDFTGLDHSVWRDVAKGQR